MADPVQPGENPSPVQTLPPGRRDAMVFIPGLSDQGLGPDQSVDGVSRRISTAFNIRAKTPSAVFRTEVREQAYGPNDCYKARVSTVFRRDESGEVALVDIYGMDYNRILTGKFERQNVLVKLLLTLLQLLSGLRLLLWSAIKSRREKTQVAYAALILLLLAAYMVVLVIAAVDVGVSALSTSPPPKQAAVATSEASSAPGTPAPAKPDAVAEPSGVLGTIRGAVSRSVWGALSAVGDRYSALRPYIRNAIVVFAAMGVVFPAAAAKAHCSAAAATYLCALHYIRLGERRNELVAQMEALLERTAELEGVQYDRTHLLAYSFGTILAIDALFRLDPEPPPSRFRRIQTLITIGCPFDLIRTYWPSYFTRRTALPPDQDQPSPPARWVNIYSPLDVLGSNFRDGDADKPAEAGVELIGAGEQRVRMPHNNVAYGSGPVSVRLWDWITLIGFRVHGLYWNREDEPSTDCFSHVVEALYKGERALL